MRLVDRLDYLDWLHKQGDFDEDQQWEYLMLHAYKEW